jgi:hypothetical protein
MLSSIVRSSSIDLASLLTGLLHVIRLPLANLLTICPGAVYIASWQSIALSFVTVIASACVAIIIIVIADHGSGCSSSSTSYADAVNNYHYTPWLQADTDDQLVPVQSAVGRL